MRAISLSHYWLHQVLNFFGISSMKVFLISTSVVLLSGFIPYFEQHVYFNFYCLILFNFVMVVDVISAIILAKIRGGSFETKLGMKAMAKFIAYNFLLYIANFLNEAMSGTYADDSFYAGLANITSGTTAASVKLMFSEYHISPFVVFLYAFIVTSLSVLKNFQLSDSFINVSLMDRWLYKNIDMYKNRPEDRLWNTLSVEQQNKILKKS